MYLKHIVRMFALVMVLLLGSLALPGAAVHAGGAFTPQESLMTYYNAINQRNYSAAYDIWATPKTDYNTFAAGFAMTERVVPYFGVFQPGASTTFGARGRVPAVMVAWETGNIQRVFYGCFHMVHPNPANGGIWQIEGAQIRETDMMGNAEIAQYMAINCYNMNTFVEPVHPPYYEVTLPAAISLLNYFDRINRDDFPAAYAYWLSPVNGTPSDYRPPYQQFVNGYAYTGTITAYVGPYTFGGAAAGKPYLDGTLPAVLVSPKGDGTWEAYAGCYIMGHLGNGTLGIVNGKFSLMDTTVPDAATIVATLKTIDCLSLGMSF